MKSYEELLAERDALATQVEFMRSALELALISVNTCYKQDWAPFSDLSTVEKAIKLSPQQCLAEIKAEAGRAGYLQALADTEHRIDGFYGTTEEEDNTAADQYAAKIRKGEL